MIVYKQWKRKTWKYSINDYRYEGWFLFGVLPLFIRRIGFRHG